MKERWIRSITTLIQEHPWRIVVPAVGLLALSTFLASSLPIDQEFRRLLPETAAEVKRLEELDRRLGNQSDLVIAIESPSREANIAFGAALTAQLRARKDLRWVLFHRERTFFEDHALLYMDLGELLELRDDVVGRIKESVRASVIEDFDDEPEDSGDADADADDPLSAESLEDRFESDQDLREYMEADEGRVIVIKARPQTGSTDLEYARQLGDTIQQMATALNPERFHPELKVTVEGSYAEHVKRAKSMRSAVVDGSLAALAILLLSIGIFFRSARAVAWILVPLLLSVTAALGFARVAYGHLNLVSAFIFAVLLGLGIDFGVHMLSRYRDERGRGLNRGDAIFQMLSTTGLSTAAGALSTAGAFLVLGFSRFQGFAQFGVVAAVGVVLALLAATLLLPALVVLMSGKSEDKRILKTAQKRSPTTSAQRAAFPTLAAVVLVVGGALAVFGATKAPGIQFEYDLSKLGNKPKKAKPKKASEPEQANANAEEKWRDAAGRGRDTAPAVVLTESLAHAETVHRQLQTLVRRRLANEAAARAADNQTAAAPDAPSPPPAETAAIDDGDDSDDDDPWGDDEDDDDPFEEESDPPEIAALRTLAAGPDVADEAVQKILEGYGPERVGNMVSRIHKIFSIYDFVPDRQKEKLVVVADMKRRIDAKRGALTAEDKTKVDEWYHQLQVTETFGVDALPGWVKEQMTDADGRLGTFVMFWTLGPKANYPNAARIRDAFFDITVQDAVVPSAADYYVLPAIIEAIQGDAPLVITGAVLVM
ncbi:MAG: hypothetical protein ACI9WU_000272, partial [Myxococcota bacterium]